MSDDNNLGPAASPPPPPPPSGGAGLGGERHVSDVAGRPAFVSKKAGVGVIIAGAVIMCGVILLTSARPNLKPEDGPKLAVHPEVAYVPPPLPATVIAAPPLPATEPPPLPTQAAGATAAPPVHHETKLLVYTSGSPHSDATGPGAGLMSPGAVGGPAGADGGAAMVGGPDGSMPMNADERQAQRETLASRLKATQLTGVSASVLQHQPFLLTTGTMIPCVLQTAMDSTLPGLVTCVIPQDIQGKTGLTLLDRGTRVVGEFKGGIRQGVERMFVVWTRAETPQGVVITLDSPATDPLGRSGMDGAIDRHFWQRFGGALLLTTVDGAIQAGVAELSKSGSTTVNTGNTESVISESLRGSINIPPTIRKNQGELVSILVARDLDFSTVYGVRRTPPQYVRATTGQNGGMWTK